MASPNLCACPYQGVGWFNDSQKDALMLPFDILTDEDTVFSFEPSSVLERTKRFPGRLPQNVWEHAVVHIQEHDVDSATGSAHDGLPFAAVLRYCAAHALLSKRHLLPNPKRVENWYMALDATTTPLLANTTLGRWRAAYGIEWLHARAMHCAPLENIWFAGHYWPTLWSAATLVQDPNPCLVGHNLERWSFLGHQWHIQHWLCDTSDDDTWESCYTSQVASPMSIRNALERTLALHEPLRLHAWQSIPRHLRATTLLDWTLTNPGVDHKVLPYLSNDLGVDIVNLSTRLDFARALRTPADAILQSLALSEELLPLPLDE